MITRRLFTFGLLAAPAIVRIGNLMPVKAAPLVLPPRELSRLHWRMDDPGYSLVEEFGLDPMETIMGSPPPGAPLLDWGVPDGWDRLRNQSFERVPRKGIWQALSDPPHQFPASAAWP